MKTVSAGYLSNVGLLAKLAGCILEYVWSLCYALALKRILIKERSYL